MAANTTLSNHMPGLRLRYGHGVGRDRISTGYSGYHPNGGRPPDAPRLAMWSPPPRHVAIWVSNDPQRCRGHNWCSISGGSRSHGVLSSKQSPRTRFFLNRTPSYNRGPGFESPKSIRNDESEGSGGQNFPLRDLPLALRACARAHLRWWHHECRPLPTGASRQSPVCSKFTAKALAGGCSRVSRRVGR